MGSTPRAISPESPQKLASPTIPEAAGAATDLGNGQVQFATGNGLPPGWRVGPVEPPRSDAQRMRESQPDPRCSHCRDIPDEVLDTYRRALGEGIKRRPA